MQRFASAARDPHEPDRLYAYHDRPMKCRVVEQAQGQGNLDVVDVGTPGGIPVSLSRDQPTARG